MSGLSRSDDYILRHVGVKTVGEISEATGIPPEKVASRFKELVGTIDILSRPDRINKIILQLEKLASEMMERVSNASDKDAAAISNSVRQIYANVIAELRNIEQMSSNEIAEMQTQYALMLSRMIGVSFERTLRSLEEKYPEIEPEVIEAEFQMNLRDAVAEFSEDA